MDFVNSYLLNHLSHLHVLRIVKGIGINEAINLNSRFLLSLILVASLFFFLCEIFVEHFKIPDLFLCFRQKNMFEESSALSAVKCDWKNLYCSKDLKIIGIYLITCINETV